MRPILFRAKALHDGSWVEGDPIHSKRMAGGFNEHRIRNQETGMETDIDPETRSQFSGEVDMHDNKVFENHIVRYNNRLYQVVFKLGGWRLSRIGKETSAYPYFFGNIRDCEIVGDIFDNPELIKKAT